MMRNLSSTPTNTSETIVIRPAQGIEDDVALRSLAELDSTKIPAGPALLAEVDSEARAALSLADGRVVADPFHHTADLAALLRARADGGARTDSRLLSGLAAVVIPAERRLRHAFAARS
jgi:hypothetical protein